MCFLKEKGNIMKNQSSTSESTNLVFTDTLPQISQQKLSSTDTNTSFKALKYNSNNVEQNVLNLFRFLREEKFKEAYHIAKALDSIGVLEGTFALSQMYHNGDYVTQNYSMEVKFLQKASKQGFKLAQYRLALAFMLGKGVEQDLEMGYEMMFDLSNDGYEPAEEFLLVQDEYDCECCNEGCEEGILVKCGESLDVVMGRLVSFIEMEDFKTAFELATELHNIGVVNGTYALSIFYHNGDYVSQDFKIEVLLLQKAAEQGFQPAIFNLALALIMGKGIEQDVENGYEMIYDLADAGYEKAIELFDEMAV